MDIIAAINIINGSSSAAEEEAQRKAVAAYLNYLILNDFAALVQLLYRVDVPEERLKTVLKENPQANAGDLLTTLLIQRQKEKIIAKQMPFSINKPSAEEAW